MQIRVIRNTSASGRVLETGQVLSVPGDLSEADARLLLALKKIALVPGIPDPWTPPVGPLTTSSASALLDPALTDEKPTAKKRK